MKYLLILVISGFVWSCNPSPRSADSSDGTATRTNDQLLDSIQYRYFRYFWDGAEPNSGLARERFHEDDIYPQNDKHVVTTGGTGFGLMSILVGIERDFISREEGVDRLLKMVKDRKSVV